jgi:hypothetical protein
MIRISQDSVRNIEGDRGINLTTKTGDIILATNGVARVSVSQAGQVLLSGAILNGDLLFNQTSPIKAIDSNSYRISICGGTSDSNSAGALATFWGNTSAGTGTLSLVSGNVASSFISLNSVHSTGSIRFLTANTERWRIDSAGDFLFNETTLIKANASNNYTLQLCGGSSFNSNSGSTISLGGAGNGDNGRIYLTASNVANSQILLNAPHSTGAIRFLTANTERWQIDGGGDLQASSNAYGVVLRSPDNTRWRITVSDLGVVSATSL